MELPETIEATGRALSFFVGIDLFLVILLILGVVFMIKILPKIIDGKITGLTKEKTALETETNMLVKNIGDTLKRLEGNQDDINVKLDENDKRYQRLEKSVLKTVIYNEHLPMLDRMEDAHDYLYLGGNGPTREYIITNIIIKDRKLWESVLQRKMEKLPEYNPKKNYEETLAEIKRALG